MNKTISVIVPIYKVEKYLPECIESLIGQTYRLLEILLVDDESPDACGAICDDYATKDSRIKVIHKKNGGAADARNMALDKATGDYIAFVDGDDYIEADMYRYMVEIMEKYDADIVQCGFNKIFVNRIVPYHTLNEKQVFNTITYISRFTEDWTCAIACDKLFKRELLFDVRYETGHCIDDEFFTYKGAMKAQRIVYTPQCLYNYRQRSSSVMKDQSTYSRKIKDSVQAFIMRYENVAKTFPELEERFRIDLTDKILYLTKNVNQKSKEVVFFRKAIWRLNARMLFRGLGIQRLYEVLRFLILPKKTHYGKCNEEKWCENLDQFFD